MLPHHAMEANFNRASSRRISWTRNDLILVLVYVMVFGVQAKLVVEASQYGDTCSNLQRYNSTKMSQVLEHLRKINKPATKSIESPDGDIIDCIDRYKQPAFDHPLLKNHKIQDTPNMPVHIKRMNITGFAIDNAQSWHVNGECPEGTIPVRRTSVEDLMRAKSLQHYGKKDVIANSHEYALVSVDGKYYGAQGRITVWNPRVEKEEFSVSQIWVHSGSAEDSTLNSVEAGWQVDFPLYGDSRTRLFIYWTADAYHKTGCYNLKCPGFVQQSRKITLGGTIWPISSYNGKLTAITINIWKDPQSKNWWMAFENEPVGYWPSQLFTNLDHASTVQWGGEIANLQTDGHHTTTQMGSGHFAEEGDGKSSHFRALKTVDDKNKLSDVGDYNTIATNAKCYNIKGHTGSDNRAYYGGPGRNANCP
ncbi:protein neprosin [Cryptomeria japonica]|uniref:protein neprosin n=1 Tax=Cryptomeria japonica TaxID=3369 RepID=UPI0027DA3255|nr:protein neprosin [Cryptomeria japonica]